VWTELHPDLQRADTVTVGPLRFAYFLAFGAVACGPSFQAVYECDVHFEHCYALDEGPASPESKEECWRAWLRGYTYGQSRDRVEYAAARFSQLSLGPTLPSEETRDARPRRRAPTVGAPVPTNAFAPPPHLAVASSVSASASVSPGAETHPPIREAVLRAPSADCSETCAQHWTACRDACEASATAQRRTQEPKNGACEQCDRTYRTCVPACFRDEPASPHPPPRNPR
jgi:hypothetical protein